MAASTQDIKHWFEQGLKNGSTHLIVVCDTWDWIDYPVYVSAKEDARKIADEHGANMQRVMEVYNLSLPMQEQLDQDRVFNY